MREKVTSCGEGTRPLHLWLRRCTVHDPLRLRLQGCAASDYLPSDDAPRQLRGADRSPLKYSPDDGLFGRCEGVQSVTLSVECKSLWAFAPDL